MVAYSFHKQFSAPILAKTKSQTLRNQRKRHAHLGETIQLYTGMRTKHCKLLATATCIEASPIRLGFGIAPFVEFDWGPILIRTTGLDQFAQNDGFASWGALVAFWRKNHPDVGSEWSGVRIWWADLKPTPQGDQP